MKKKYIGIAVLFAAGSLLAGAGTLTVTTADKDDQGIYYGFTLALGADSAALTDPGNILAGLSGEEVVLENVSVLSRTNNTYSNSRLAVYSFVEDGNVGDFIGLSDSVAFQPNTNLDFRFEGINLEVGQRYQFLFVEEITTGTDLTNSDETTLPLLELYQQYAMPLGIAVTANQYSGTTLPVGWGTYKSSGLNSWEGHRMPVVSLTVSSAQIPEPSTFGALVGVGAILFATVGRRRKKAKPPRSGNGFPLS